MPWLRHLAGRRKPVRAALLRRAPGAPQGSGPVDRIVDYRLEFAEQHRVVEARLRHGARRFGHATGIGQGEGRAYGREFR